MARGNTKRHLRAECVWPSYSDTSLQFSVFSTKILTLKCTDLGRYNANARYMRVLNWVTDVNFEVFTAVTMKNVVFWDIKTQFVLHRRHTTSQLQSPAS
jgi:hypothetical protein